MKEFALPKSATYYLIQQYSDINGLQGHLLIPAVFGLPGGQVRGANQKRVGGTYSTGLF